MEWDEVVDKIAGTEGAPRYKRVGAFLLAVSFIAFLSLLFVPLFTSADVSYSYFDLTSEPEEMPFGVPNEQVTGHVNLSLVGCVLIEVIGLLFILEGYRVINLRRVLVWHAEARATALYSLAAATSMVALAGIATIWGLVISMSLTSPEGDLLLGGVDSPGTLVAMIMIGLSMASMLFMAYYSCVLSVYRGGVTPRTRHMARLAMLVALVCVIGIIVVRMGVIATVTVETTVDVNVIAEEDVYYTKARIDHYAEDASEYPYMASLASQLGGIQIMLALALLAALAGSIGVSAYSLGGESLKVRRTASLPALAVFFTVFAGFYVMSAGGFAEAAVKEVWGDPMPPAYLSWGFYLALLLVLAGIALTAMYLREVDYEFVIDAFAFWKGFDKPDEEEEPLEGSVTSPEGPGDEGPIEVEPVPKVTPPRKPRLSRPKMMVLAIVLVSVILIAAVAGVMVLRPPSGGNGGNPGRTPVVVEELPPFSEQFTDILYLNEGSTELYDALVEVFGVMDGIQDRVYFVEGVTVTVQWADEPDAGIRWTNQPDTFSAEVRDQGNVFATGQDSDSNPQGGNGNIMASWNSAEFWLAWGNTGLVDTGEADVIRESTVVCQVDMDQAGDQTTRLGLTQTDPGNECAIHIQVTGTYYLEDKVTDSEFIDHLGQVERLALEGSTATWVEVAEETLRRPRSRSPHTGT